jgi:hypothetical protein
MHNKGEIVVWVCFRKMAAFDIWYEVREWFYEKIVAYIRVGDVFT